MIGKLDFLEFAKSKNKSSCNLSLGRVSRADLSNRHCALRTETKSGT